MPTSQRPANYSQYAAKKPVKGLTPAEKANIIAHTSTPAQRAANVRAHQPGATATKPPAAKPASPTVSTAPQTGTAAQIAAHAARVRANIAAHTATPAQENANRVAHGLAALPATSTTSAVPAGYHAVHIPDPNADPDFMQTQADLANQLNTYKQQEQHGIAQYGVQYNQAEGALGYNPATKAFDPSNITPGTYGAAMRDTNNDYGSRGLGDSSSYYTANQQLGNDYAHRANALTTGMNSYNQQQSDSYNQYKAQNDAALNLARRTAVGNIAAQYGVQPTQVVPGKANTVNVANP